MSESIEPVSADVETLGEPKVDSPLPFQHFVPHQKKVTMEIPPEIHQKEGEDPEFYTFEKSGPKESIYFDNSSGCLFEEPFPFRLLFFFSR